MGWQERFIRARRNRHRSEAQIAAQLNEQAQMQESAANAAVQQILQLDGAGAGVLTGGNPEGSVAGSGSSGYSALQEVVDYDPWHADNKEYVMGARWSTLGGEAGSGWHKGGYYTGANYHLPGVCVPVGASGTWTVEAQNLGTSHFIYWACLPKSHWDAQAKEPNNYWYHQTYWYQAIGHPLQSSARMGLVSWRGNGTFYFGEGSANPTPGSNGVFSYLTTNLGYVSNWGFRVEEDGTWYGQVNGADVVTYPNPMTEDWCIIPIHTSTGGSPEYKMSVTGTIKNIERGMGYTLFEGATPATPTNVTGSIVATDNHINKDLGIGYEGTAEFGSLQGAGSYITWHTNASGHPNLYYYITFNENTADTNITTCDFGIRPHKHGFCRVYKGGSLDVTTRTGLSGTQIPLDGASHTDYEKSWDPTGTLDLVTNKSVQTRIQFHDDDTVIFYADDYPLYILRDIDVSKKYVVALNYYSDPWCGGIEDIQIKSAV